MFLLGLADAIYDRERDKWMLSWGQITNYVEHQDTMQSVSGAWFSSDCA